MASDEDFVEAGLYDPEVDVANGRLDLLHWLAEQGFTIDEMTAAFKNGSLGALAGDRRIVEGPRLSGAQVQELTGVSPARVAAIATAFGFASPDPAFPTELGLTEPEAKALARLTVVAEMFSEQELFGFVRVVGSSVGRIAEAAVSLFLSDVEGPFIASNASELDLAKNVLGAVELLDDFIPMLDPVLRRHVHQTIERTRLTIIDDNERLVYRYAVGFVDLVGFTPLSRDMSAKDLGAFIRDFEAKATNAVTAAGARLVKLIGDEIMFVAPTPDSACEVAQTLMSGFVTVDGGSIAPRGGVAYGPVLVRGGDYYGDMVNVASRLADEAQPSELLVTEAFASATSCLEFERSGTRSLKGFAEPVAVRSVVFEQRSGGDAGMANTDPNTPVQDDGDRVAMEWRGRFHDSALNELHAEAFQHRLFDDQWATQLERHSLGWVTAKRGPTLIGFVNVVWDGGVHAWIQDTIVAIAERRNGVAKEMIDIAKQNAASAGCEWLHVDFDDHLRPFYFDGCGFTPTNGGLIELQS